MSPRLDQLTLDIERHAAVAGWDQPVRLFALVETADLVSREPQLAEQLGVAAVEPGSLTPVDQGDLPEHASLEELLAGITWPPDVERDMPQDEGEALRWLAEHPQREEVRIVVAVLRDGTRSTALRMRSHD